jgi:hypothetical protein
VSSYIGPCVHVHIFLPIYPRYATPSVKLIIVTYFRDTSDFITMQKPQRYWPRPAMEPAFDVVGIAYKRDAATKFARAVMKCEVANRSYGVVGIREPRNPHDPNAIMVFGYWVERGWFGGEKTRRVHVGYVPADFAADVVKAYGPERDPDLSLFSVYLGDDGHVDITAIALRP